VHVFSPNPWHFEMSCAPSPQNDPPDHHCVANPASKAPAISLSELKGASSNTSNRKGPRVSPKNNFPLLVYRLKSAIYPAFKACLRNVRTFVLQIAGPLRHRFIEEKGVVIDQARWLTLRRCSIHLLPVMATIALTALRFNGYYLGTNFKDSNQAKIDTVDTLALQVTSKLMVRDSQLGTICHRSVDALF
jgi:hypothetical protein